MDVMSIARLSTQMANVNLMNEVNVRLLDRALEQAGSQVEDLMQTLDGVPAVNLDGIGSMIDIRI